jgi:hypothetical protein
MALKIAPLGELQMNTRMFSFIHKHVQGFNLLSLFQPSKNLFNGLRRGQSIINKIITTCFIYTITIISQDFGWMI